MELRLGEVSSHEHWDDTGQNLHTDLVRTKLIARLLVNLEYQHANFRIKVSRAPKLLKRLEHTLLDCIHIDAFLKVMDCFQASNANLHVLGILQDFHHAWNKISLE